MRGWDIVAFLLLAAAAVLAAIGKAWPVALVAAGLAVELVPTVFQLTA